MATLVFVVVVWVLLSIPVSLCAGRFIRGGRGQEPPDPPETLPVRRGDPEGRCAL